MRVSSFQNTLKGLDFHAKFDLLAWILTLTARFGVYCIINLGGE